MKPTQWIKIITGIVLLIIPIGYMTYLRSMNIDMTSLRFELTYTKEIVCSLIVSGIGYLLIKRTCNKL